MTAPEHFLPPPLPLFILCNQCKGDKLRLKSEKSWKMTISNFTFLMIHLEHLTPYCCTKLLENMKFMVWSESTWSSQRSCVYESEGENERGVESECEGSQPVMDAMADARVRVVISVPGALWKRARYRALIGPTVAVLFATVQL